MKGKRSAKKSITTSSIVRRGTRRTTSDMASFVTSLEVLDDVSLKEDEKSVVAPSRFEKLLEDVDEGRDQGGDGVDYEEKEMCILSQDFFW